jgi:hypothetical protein
MGVDGSQWESRDDSRARVKGLKCGSNIISQAVRDCSRFALIVRCRCGHYSASVAATFLSSIMTGRWALYRPAHYGSQNDGA